MGGAYRPLEGIRVVELSTMVAASSCGRMLADWGCDVVKVESPEGDMYRQVPAFFNVPCSMDENPLFDSLNAGKEGIVLDLKTREGMEVMHRLLAEADIFITNNRKKALDRLGLNYESLKGKYPKLIYATITGFGDAGPKADAPGFDTVAFWASSGFNADMMVDEPGAYPVYSSSGPGDIISAMGLCYAITAALYKRTQTGIGDRVTISLYGTALWCFSLMAVASEERYGYKYPRTREQSSPTGSPYRTKDGEWVMATIVQFDKHWPKLCEALELNDLANDPRYASTVRQRLPENNKYLVHRLEEAYAKFTCDEICQRLRDADIAHDRLAHYREMEHSEQAWANEFIHCVTCPNGKESVLVRPPMRSEKMGIPTWKRGPMLGEHTDKVLNRLGYTSEEISAYKENGGVRQLHMGSEG